MCDQVLPCFHIVCHADTSTTDELHIENWDAYFTVFKAGTRFNRDLSFYNNPQIAGSILNVADGEVAKPHKNLYLSAFSKAAVNRLEPLIHEKLGLFLERLATAAFKSSVVHLNAAYCCLTADVVMYYCYQRTFGFLDAPNFEVQMIKDLEDFTPMVPSFWYFPRFSAVMFNFVNFLSESARRKYFPAAAALNAIVEQCRERLTSLSTLPPDSKDLENSIFKSALHPDRSKGQYIASSSELVGDAVLMFLAGTDTTANTLTIGTWHILKDPTILARLRANLDPVMPDPDTLYPQSALESLPYLRAIIKESLRLSYGTTARLMRIVPAGGATLCDQHIPADTRISFSHTVYNNDPDVFKNPHEFRPERWLGDPEEVSRLEAHMISFSRGSRSCLGIKLVLSLPSLLLCTSTSACSPIRDSWLRCICGISGHTAL